MKHNVYFDGKVQSLGLTTEDGCVKLYEKRNYTLDFAS